MPGCPDCNDGHAVVVKHVKHENSPSLRGNKYRLECLNCDDPANHIRMASETAWEISNDQYVTPSDDAQRVTLEEYEQTDTDTEETNEEPENEFDCPQCGTHHTGFPETCSNCNAPYDW